MSDSIDPLLECLHALCGFYGRPLSRDSLVAGLPLVDTHLTPRLFARAAARARLTTRILHRSLDALPEALLPAVLLLQDGGACLLLGVDGGQARVILPELNQAEAMMPLGQLQERFSGRLILARPLFAFDQRTPEVTKVKQRHWFWGVLLENQALYRDVLLAALLINVFALAMPIFTMNVYDRVVPNHAVETLWMLAVGVSVVLLADVALRSMRGYFVDLASSRIDIKLSARIMEKVLGLRLEVRPASAGSFASNLRAFESVRDFIASTSVTALIDLPFALIFLGVIAWIAPAMLWPPLIGSAVAVAYGFSVQRSLKALTETTFRASAQRNATLIESLVGLETLKAMRAEGVMQRRWESAAAFLARTGIKLRFLASSSSNVVMWTQQLVSVALIIVGVYLITAGELSMGGLIACSMLASRAMAPLGQVAALVTQYHNAATALTSLNEVMERPEERPEGAQFLARERVEGALEFRQVSFHYPESEQMALRQVSFTVKPGEHVAILGRIGSGKSTIQKLAMGLYQPTDGAVFVDGIDLRQLDPAEFRRQVGYVPQDVTLFFGTLRDNITLGSSGVDDGALQRAVELAGIADFVKQHPKGFDMPISERGDSLSGGQRRAVALARALVNDPPVLLLDEPTGSMDHSSEALVRQHLARYAQGRTLVVVTHRTSLLDLVDRILVVDAGTVVADGPKASVVEALRKGRIGRAAS